MLCQRSKPPTTSRNGLRGRFGGGQAVNKPTTHWMPPMHLLPLLPFAHSQVKHMEYDLLHWMAKLSQLRQVSVKHIRKLADIDAERDLKLAPHLKPAYLDQDHFAKMNVASAVAVLNHSVGAAIRVLVSLGRMEEEALTTAWFVERVYRWFTLMTSRYIGTAMSMFKPDAHDEAVAFLREFMEIFAHVSIKSNRRDQFKPVQAGVLISTTSALQIQHQLLSVHKFKFVLLCRLTQDALENLFSCIRSRHPVPRALEFKLMLRLIMLSQFFKPSRKGSYDIDDSVDLLEFVEMKKAAQKNSVEAAEVELLTDSLLDDDAPPLDDVQMESLVYVAGYVTHSVSKKFKLCDTCRECLQAEPVEQNEQLLKLKSYRSLSQPNPLTRPSGHVVSLLQHADSVFRAHEHDALTVSLASLTNAALDKCQLANSFPHCHDLQKRLTQAFLMLRLRITLRKLQQGKDCKGKMWIEKCWNEGSCLSDSLVC
ncbi:hypothetical protein HPB48_000545 [Haemaphysalis longicornis]|uniref:Transposable element P transposase-like GTP-binding insertion domain-containing protein n=1 Tax=Haemaphysalis longicornis TaxID=44386 RepID=A0A9J6GMH3_HAELO|nr:hypothetical protein HPB48_000545 [Haemaphysalis longicornis]